MLKKLMCLAGVMLSCFWLSSHAGTLTAEKIEASEVLVKEIGLSELWSNGALFFPFTSNENNNVTDESGDGYDGKTSGCYWKNSGPHGGCMVFDGYGDYIDVGPAPDVPAWDQYSISVWFLHDGKGDFTSGCGHNIIDKSSPGHEWYLRVCPPYGYILFCMGEGFPFGLSDSSRNYMDNKWHHVVVTRYGGSGTMWIDGVLTRSTIDGMKTVNSTSKLCVGNSFGSNTKYCKSWSGMLDELRIYDYPLSRSKILQLYYNNALVVVDANAPKGIVVSTSLIVTGEMTAAGRASFNEGVIYSKPLGGLSCGIYTNTP